MRTRDLRFLLTSASLLLFMMLFAAQSVSAQQTFTVNSLADTDDSTCDAGNCTLREAIDAANAAAGADTINFSVSGTISVTSLLPDITEAVTIDGGGTQNTSCTGTATMAVVLEGSGAGSGVSGLTLAAGSAGSTIQGLNIQGFDGNGIEIASDNNVIQGNFIGTNQAGNAAAGNSSSGINVTSGSGNTIGGTSFANRNVISGNRGNGVTVSGFIGSSGNFVRGNYIGTNAAGTASVGNSFDGIEVFQSANNVIGGSSATTGCAPGNLISGNGEDGVSIFGTSSTGNSVQGNLIGTNAAGDADLGNTSQGVYIFAVNNLVGGSTSGFRNVVSGNDGGGVNLAGGSSNNVQNNYIGTNLAGTAAIGNPDGVRIDTGSNNNFIGISGSFPLAGFAVNGKNQLVRTDLDKPLDIEGLGKGEIITNIVFRPSTGQLYGLGKLSRIYVINPENAVASEVSENAFSPKLDGTEFNFDFDSESDHIRVISNTGQELEIDPNLGRVSKESKSFNNDLFSSDKRLAETASHRIDPINDLLYVNDWLKTGSTTSGSLSLTNLDKTDNSTVVGSLGMDVTGVKIFEIIYEKGVSTGYAVLEVEGKLSIYKIDLSTGFATLESNLGKTSDFENFAFGPMPALNVISGNDVGVHIAGGDNNLVRANLIGTGSNGTSDVGNTEAGVYIHDPEAVDNSIGGTGANDGNAIHYNGDGSLIANSGGEGGVVVYLGATENQILGNSITNNTGLGIDLDAGATPTIGADGMTANDPNDVDSGDANNLQNYPVLATADTAAGMTTIAGTFNSTPSRTFRVEYFSDAAADASGNGEGRTFFGSQDVTTDASGNATINFVSSFSVPAGEVVSATATDSTTGDTSEFSNAVTVAAGAGVSISGKVLKNGNPLPGVTIDLSGDVTSTTTTDQNGDYSFDGLPSGGDYLVTPSLQDHTFTPTSRPYNNVTADINDADFTATESNPISISGNITKNASGLSGVTVTLSGDSTDSTVTDGNGDYSFTNLTSGGRYLVTPSLAGNTFSPTNRSYSNQTTDVTDADFVAFDNGQNPRILRVVDTPGTPGQPVTVPIQIDSQGDEDSFTFSLSYDSAILSNPVLNCGSDAGSCTFETNTTVAGQVGVSIDPENPFIPGTRELATVTFDVAATSAPNTPVNFTDTPAVRETSDANANPLPTTYDDGLVTFPQGLESDVSPRPDGDGFVTPVDVTQIRRFAVGFDQPYQSNEFQRADAAPRSTSGDGIVAASDVTQARRYQVGLDPTQPADGPTSFFEGPNSDKSKGLNLFDPVTKDNEDNVIGPRTVRVVDQNTTAGQTISVEVRADAVGDEDGYNFSLSYDTSVLTIGTNGVQKGTDAGSAALTVNTTNPGRIGVNLDFLGTPIAAGDRQLITIEFDVAANAEAGRYPVRFGNVPAPLQTTNTNGDVLQTNYATGNVDILATTTGNVRVEDKSTSAGQQVTVRILANPTGDEADYGFSINYDTSILTLVDDTCNDFDGCSVKNGSDSQARGGSLAFANVNTPGRIGFSMGFPFAGIGPGTDLELATITFQVNPGTAPGTITPVTFGNMPAFSQASRNGAGGAEIVPTNFIDGEVKILDPTSAGVSVSGRVTLGESRSISNAIVVLTNSRNGEVITARTNAFGYFRMINVDAGESYVVDVQRKGYSFDPQVINVDDSITGLKLNVESP